MFGGRCRIGGEGRQPDWELPHPLRRPNKNGESCDHSCLLPNPHMAERNPSLFESTIGVHPTWRSPVLSDRTLSTPRELATDPSAHCQAELPARVPEVRKGGSPP